MNPTLATLMVAKDAAESDDEETRSEMLNELVDVAYVEHVGYGNNDGTWSGPLSWLLCSWCSVRYTGLDGPKQATDCAASVWQRDGVWYALGHYGSRAHDMTLYRFVQNFPREPADPVCDACLNVRLASGDMVVEQENVL